MPACDGLPLCSRRARIRFALHSMTETSPDSDAWLRQLIARSLLLPEANLRRHWQTLVPRLPRSARYELAAVLLEVEHSLA